MRCLLARRSYLAIPTGPTQLSKRRSATGKDSRSCAPLAKGFGLVPIYSLPAVITQIQRARPR